MARTTQTYEADLATGIPTSAPVRTAKDKYHDWLKSGAPWPWHGVTQPPKGWEEQQWLNAFRHLGCDIKVSAFGGFAYRVPRKAEDEGFPLLEWLAAAEHRAPGIIYRVHVLATQYNEIKAALERLSERSDRRAAA